MVVRSSPKSLAEMQLAIIGLLGLPVFYAFYKISSRYLERRAFTNETALDELSVLGKPHEGKKIRGSAVIVGGSVAGLMTALACSNHFDDVVIIEPDEGADENSPVAGIREHPNGLKSHQSRRTRIIQTFALHQFQPFLLLALRKWFPDFDKHAIAAGARISQYNLSWWYSGRVMHPPQTLYPGAKGLPKHPNLQIEIPPEALWIGRMTLEPLVRGLTLERYKNIRVIRALATGFVLDDKKTKITAVAYTPKGGKSEQVEAAFVADCSGSAIVGSKWLPRVGGPAPKVIQFNPNLRYGSVIYHVPEEKKAKLTMLPGGWYGTEWFWSGPSLPRYGATATLGCKLDGDRVIIGFGGWGIKDEDTPRFPEEIKKFHRALPIAPGGTHAPEWFCELVDVLSADGGWEDSKYESYHINNCTLVEYHSTKGLPHNFVAIGDSIMRASPVYGLGVAKACVGAAKLEGVLAATQGPDLPNDFSKTFFQRQHACTAWSWDSSKDSDYMFATTEPVPGEKLKIGSFSSKVMSKFVDISGEEPEVSARFYHARMWMYPQSVLMTKGTLMRSFWRALMEMIA